MNWLRNIRKGLWNFWFFRREIWNFRDFDYSYNLDLFRRSLLPLQARLKDGITMSGPEDAKSIQRFLDATDDTQFWDVCEEYKKHLRSIEFRPIEGTDMYELFSAEDTSIPPQRKKQLIKRIYKWEEARWKRAITELSKMRGWWE